MISEEIQCKDVNGRIPQKSIEGWILIVTNVHEETQEDDIYDAFSKFGTIKSIHLNMDRKTGFAKGYALLEFDKFEQAKAAISNMNQRQINERQVSVDWAFQEKSLQQQKKYKEKKQ